MSSDLRRGPCPFPERCCGFRRGITARLSPKPLDLNVNELYLVQGTRATASEDPASVQCLQLNVAADVLLHQAYIRLV